MFPLLAPDRMKLHQEPFLHGYIDQYLPAEAYRRLAASFIDPATHPGVEVLGRGKKRLVFRAPPVPDFIAQGSEAWSEAVRALSAPAFIGHCLAWLRANLSLDSQPAGAYRSLIAARIASGPERLQMQCEFSTMERGTLLPPHADSPDKVMSFVLYFPPPEWQAAWGGETEIYAPKDPKHRYNWGNRIVAADAMHIISSSDYRPNRLFFFAKASNAWHGVAPIVAPAGVQRRSFNFSLVVSASGLGAAPEAGFEEEIARLEAENFRTS